MGQEDAHSESTGEQASWSRRTVMKASAAGAGLAALVGANSATAQENGDGEESNGTGESEDGDDETENGAASDSATVFDDLIDPVWGYPLDADESDAVTIDPVVELRTEAGEGDYPDFPTNPETGEGLPFEFVFDPVGVHLLPGTVVKFQAVAGEHTATAFHEKFSIPQRPVATRVPEDVPGFTSPPVVDGEAWLYEFSTAGVYDVLCLPHVSLGMVMRAVVFDPESDDIEGDTFSVPEVEQVSPNAEAVLTAPELDPANIVESGTVGWDELTIELPEATATPTPSEETSRPE